MAITERSTFCVHIKKAKVPTTPNRKSVIDLGISHLPSVALKKKKEKEKKAHGAAPPEIRKEQVERFRGTHSLFFLSFHGVVIDLALRPFSFLFFPSPFECGKRKKSTLVRSSWNLCPSLPYLTLCSSRLGSSRLYYISPRHPYPIPITSQLDAMGCRLFISFFRLFVRLFVYLDLGCEVGRYCFLS